MREKRTADTALFRRRIDAEISRLQSPIADGGAALTKYETDACLTFARFAIRALRAMEAITEHPEDCLCQRCDYRPEVERSVEEVRANG